jgi:hypothetical protein
MAGPQQRNLLIPPTPEEEPWWRADTEKLRKEHPARMQADFDIALALWGEEEGRRRWRKVSDKRGRAKGSTRPQQDHILLRIYDLMAGEPGQNIKRLPRLIAKLVTSKSRETPKAVEKRLRRLLARRTMNPLNQVNRDK